MILENTTDFENVSFDCMAKSLVSITVCKTVERFTPLYDAIMNSMENLRFGEEDYFHVLVFLFGLFYKRNRKHFLTCSHTL